MTREALFGEQFSEALRTIRLIVTGRKPLTCQRLLTTRAIEAFAMKRLILVCDTTLRYNFRAFGAFGGKVLLITRYTIDLVVLGYEAFSANGRIACKT